MPSTPRPDVTRVKVQEPADLDRHVVGAVIEMDPYRTIWLVESLEEQLERGFIVVVPLASELVGAGGNEPAAEQHPPKRHLPVVGCSWRVDTDLNHPGAVPIGPGHGLRRLVLLSLEYAEGQSTRGLKGPPAVMVTDEVRSQVDGPTHGAVGIFRLEVQVYPRWSVDHLKMDIRCAQRWREAAQFGMPRPRRAQLPPEGIFPKVGHG